MLDKIRAELAPTGVLRAAINLSNFLLVSGRSPTGDPQGVSPDMARAVADRLAVPVEYVTFETPGALADAAVEGGVDGVWDIGNIGAEPERAKTIAFTPAYAEIEATYLVPAGSSILSVDEVDQDGTRISVSARSAYGLWLSDHIESAELVPTAGVDESFDAFVADGLEVLAGLRPRLLKDVTRLHGARLLDGKFTAVQQAIGTRLGLTAAAEFLRDFVEEAKASGFVRDLIDRHGVQGQFTVAPRASAD
jgi:polar amino acid transport system substrate-binding protein